MSESKNRLGEEPDLQTEDGLRAVLSAAGRRPPVPAADLEGITAAARGEWLALIARRRTARRSRWLLAAASLLVLAGAGWWWRTQGLGGPSTAAPVVLARVERWSGDARIAGQAASRRDLPAGTVLATADPGGFLSFRLTSGVSLRLDAASRVRLVSPGAVELQRGAVYIDSPAAATGAIEVQSELGDVRDVGTQFEVRLEDGAALRVRVREGQVELRRGERTLQARAGEGLAWRDDGSELRETISPLADSWRWAVQAAVAPEIEGMTLGVFLDWVSRETGRQVRFADPELARSAASTVLHGTIEGLAPDEAVSVVLPGSGLAYRVEGATLVLERSR